ncbi:post-transcriptional regulator [Enterococcus mediterraneensis]|uniref:post-transcriptional regulator n=1 Tax=Enterococcus mediterraneensis TaxID=2364791 RepID=UPI0013DF7B51|nr:post-transcriptional regulator [Enterococcus mediterraneensis]
MKITEKIYLYHAFYQKLKQFKKAGYQTVTKAELMAYCQNYLWRRKNAETLKQQKQTLSKITPNDFFDYQQLQIQTKQQSFAELDDFSDLF